MENCHSTGLINDMEWRLYCDWHTHLLGALGGLHIDGLVYLRVSPEVRFDSLPCDCRTSLSLFQWCGSLFFFFFSFFFTFEAFGNAVYARAVNVTPFFLN